MMKTQPIPKLAATSFDKNYVPTCLGNGLIGLTPGPNPLLQGKVVVGGFVFSHPTFEFENFALAPYPLGIDLRAAQKSLRDHKSLVSIKRQSLDMETGELTTHMTFKPGNGLTLDLEVMQFASRSVPSLVCQELRISSNKEVEIQILSRIDRECITGEVYTGDTDALTRGWYDEDLIDRCIGFATDRSRLGIATCVMRRPEVAQIRPGNYRVKLSQKEGARFQIIAAMIPELYNPDPHLEAIRLARWGEMLGFETLRRYNRDAWAELWKSRIKIDGPEEDQRALDVAFYYLHSNVHAATKAGTPPFGLTQHDKYYGHNFWDTDLWMLIPQILTSPDAARATVEYRFRGLDAAKNKARLFGYRGALYPWEGALDGSEVTPSSCPTGWAQQHTTPGVAIGVWEYQLAAGDENTLRDITWPILKAVAEYIESRGVFTERGFEVRHMMGHDEGVTNTSNQTYFNLLSRMAVDAAIQCAGKLGLTPPENWQKIAELMVIPIDAKKRIVMPYDLSGTVRIHNPEKHIFEEVPAKDNLRAYSIGNLHYLFIHNCPVDDDLFRNTYFHEEKIRLSREPGGVITGSTGAPGFTSPPWAACAAFCGERDKAAVLFRNAWENYWLEPFGMLSEYQSQHYGSYITSFGSILQATLLGFTGLRIQEGDWVKYPASLPEGWSRIEVDRIWVRGKPMKLVAEHGKKAELSDM